MEDSKINGLSIDFNRMYCWFFFLVLISAINNNNNISSATAATNLGNQIDHLALLAFKDQITNSNSPLGAVSSWNDTISFCHWEGITCSSSSSNDTKTEIRVSILNLQSHRMAGFLSPHLGNLTLLRELNLGDNSFQGEIPSELGKLIHLRLLNLTTNSLQGKIPANISSCKELELLDLSDNLLVGQIPPQLTTLSKLDVLSLSVNNLTGEIPPSIGNLSSSLTGLILGRNGLDGSIPATIGLLTSLDFLQIAENQLSGTIPQSLYSNLSSLTFITVATNQLHGTLPPNLGIMLPDLETLYVGGNHLSGLIPVTLLNASRLVNLDLAYNNFTGSVPAGIGRWGGLQWLNFEGNQLGTGNEGDLDFLTSLTNCSNLQVLGIYDNRFGGLLPNSIANLSTQLSMLVLGANQIQGSIPNGIENLVGLTVLRLEHNSLVGSIPSSIGRLRNLELLSLFRNRLSGQIPPTLGNLTRLNDLRLADNAIQGSIPSSLANCRSIQNLDLSRNRLSGPLPVQILSISSLSIFLGLAQNSLVGPLPEEIGNLKNLGELDISENRLSGEIPPKLGGCESLEYLHMQGNMFRGSIPSTLNKLKGISYLDLSRNNLSGQVPQYLGSLQFLWYLNLSYNDFDGEVPKEGVFGNASALSILGDTKLCGGLPTLQLSPCPAQNSERSGRRHRIIVPIACAVSGLVLLASLFVVLYYRKRPKIKRSDTTSSMKAAHLMVSYKELHKATNGFSSTNLIGEGSFGTVYRGTLGSDEEVVAIKVFNHHNHGAYKSFLDECEALRHARHRNLIRILTSCSSVDSAGNDFKALVYEFMPNGTLDEWLHPKSEEQTHSKILDIVQRLSISIDVAAALEYLHHQGQQPIVHCDLKPSNVLLDEIMTARVGDFGLARILLADRNSQQETNSIAIKGSIGYVPPEYGLGREISMQGDVYSYGILLLEMFTGKRPTDKTINGGSCLHDFVKMAFPDRVMEITDSQLLLHQEKIVHTVVEQTEISRRKKKCLASVFSIGLSCSAASPKQRMNMTDVAAELHAIRILLLGEKGNAYQPK